MSFQPPKGTFDVAAGTSQMLGDPDVWRSVLAAWERRVLEYGYPLVITPVFEATELFERGVGESTEIVNKEMYTFTDKGGRSVTLRPEGTAGVVRAYLNLGAQGVWKGAYSGPMFRYERPQKGRYRQFWQVGVEYLDVEGAAADAEVVELGYRYLEEIGVPGLEMKLNSLGCRECRPDYVSRLRDHLDANRHLLGDESQKLIETNPVRILDSKVDRDALSDAPIMADHLCEACRDHFDSVQTFLNALGVPFTLDPYLVRGLDYYTRTTFEYVATELDAAQNAVGGGGRYDGLAESIGGRRSPGVGLALGIDRAILTLKAPPRSRLQVYIVSEAGVGPALELASELRSQGLSVDFDSEGRSVKAQFRASTRRAAGVTIVVGDEMNEVEMRAGGERVRIPTAEVKQWVEERDL